MSEPTLLQQLAQRIVAFGPKDLTPKAIALSRTAIIDTLGVTLAGAPEPCVTNLLRTPGIAEAPGPCTLYGTDRKTSALDAAFINGTASHALDYDDFSQPMGGHQSAPLVAPLMAVAEARHISGARLVESYILGVEVEIRLARSVNFHHYDKGWHPTATMGVFGAAAGVAHMIGLDEKQTAIALAIAASFASGLKSNFGTMVKPLHVGQCARNGLLAALLAESGYDANPASLEHKQGFFNAFNGPGTFDPSQIFAEWASPLEVLSDTMGLKQFPCCGSTHPAVAMALELHHKDGVTGDTIAHVDVLPHKRRLPHTDNPNPQTPLQAKFSHQYAVARALSDGALRLAHFEGEAHFDPAVRAVMAKLDARPHPDMADNAEHQFSAEVRVTLKDGRTLSRRVEGLTGRGGENPMSSDELWEKFNDCAKRALPKGDVLPLFEKLESLEKVGDVADVARLMARRQLPGAGPARAAQAAPEKKVNTLLETSWVP